ncbi:hypothetical protein Cs7R123_24520 [Catellatospora sp. TT07R-123]|uniref:hypothetical protein n=1 Tax=Catellatospora sp. TT07R-123 TaxID=2733863 RepID=UPI001B0A4321|nr:hypothetical protein [Catellatospora sp. TT07R-123]GHJ45110.1 hypothetical protein Cs7R123_24520 [Catellatospora sp. TT07R-123]
MRDNPYQAPANPAAATAVAEAPVPVAPADPNQVRARQMWRGLGLSALGHLGTVLAATVFALAFGSGPDYYGSDIESVYAVTGLISQGLLAVAAVTYSVVRLVRRDTGTGTGVLVGWGVGLMVTPVVAVMVLVILTR